MLKKLYKLIRNTLFTPLIWKDLKLFRKLDKKNRFPVHLKDLYPQPFDKTILTGFDRHYVYHTAWAARKVKEINPQKHIDISSSLYFSCIVSAFVPVDFYDYRPAELSLSGLSSKHADLIKLPFSDNSILSLSCMHTVEHIGLGRYSDPLDPEADIKAITELKRVLAPGGSLLFVVPIGNKAKIMFNAHRIYTIKMIQELFADFTLKEFTLIPERHGDMQINPDIAVVQLGNYDCGCFWFVKKN
jgi:SAM-dependent methyltransferase